MARTAARRFALGLTAAGALGLGLFWLRARAGGPREERPAPEQPERAAEALAALSDALAPVAAQRPVSERHAAVPTTAAQSTTTGPDGPQPLEVHVMVAGAPAADARVLLGPALGYDRNDRARLLGWRSAPTEDVLAADGTVAITDHEGSARFAIPARQSLLVARRGDRFALRTLPAYEPGPVTLELEPDPPIRVLVVDAEGRPQPGIPVGLGYRDRRYDLVRATTDAVGIAIVRAAEQRTELARRGACVSLALLLAEPVAVPVDPVAPPPNPLVLCLPPTGSLAISLADEDGDPWTGRAEIWGRFPACRCARGTGTGRPRSRRRSARRASSPPGP